jgi:hypothetical protein
MRSWNEFSGYGKGGKLLDQASEYQYLNIFLVYNWVQNELFMNKELYLVTEICK